MLPRDLVYVGHMLDMARKAVAKVRDLPRETYNADENLRLALIHLVQVIGEAARQVSREFTSTHPEIVGDADRSWLPAGCRARPRDAGGRGHSRGSPARVPMARAG